jgi:medium-chain acyl-[acyl-carrier-protein] hydrolase
VFLGHSLGAVIAFEMVRELRRQSASLPEHLFICGCSAPQTPMIKPSVYKLPQAAFIAELCDRYHAIPESIRQDEELMALFLPTLRADFTLLETYIYTPENPLDCPISAFGGWQDAVVSENSLVRWQEQTQGSFTLKMLPGDHFFLHNHPSVVLQTIINRDS